MWAEVIIMLIHEVCNECGLTKKAIEYYIEQKLVQPKLLENGYRNFSANDIERLKKIATLRRLGLSIQSIAEFLDKESPAALYQLAEKKKIALDAEKEKQALIRQLAEKQDWDSINSQLEAIEKKQTILQRMLDAFPGYYGRYLSLHFAAYLNEPIVSDEQQAAFETIVDFLDNIDFELPTELQQYLDEITRGFDEAFAKNVFDSMNHAVHAPEKYIEENRETLAQYMQFKQSDEYKNSSAYRMEEYLKKLNHESGYDTVFIPAMKQLSLSYRRYHNALMSANDVFTEQFL